MSKSAFLAGGALLCAGIVGYSFLSSQPKSSSRDLGEIDDQEDTITAKEIGEIFDALFLSMQDVLSKIMQQLQAIQMAGQQIPEAQIKAIMKMEMERALADKQTKLLDSYGMDYDCLEEATWEFLEEKDPVVTKAVDRFQKLWETTTGEPVAGWRPGQAAGTNAVDPKDLLAPERLIEVAQIYFNALTEKMRSLVAQYRAEGKSLQDPAVQQQLNRDFANQANSAGEEALSKEGLSMKVFEASIKEHQGNATVGRALATMQMRQQQELMSIGQG